MEVVLYKRRWLVLLAVCLGNIANNTGYMTFGSVSSFAIEYYGSNYAPMLFSVIFLALSPITFYAAHVINKPDGLRISCLVGTWATLLGSGLRAFAASPLCPNASWLADDHRLARFWFTIAGQCILALASPFGQCLPTKLAAVWFRDDERVLVNSIGSLSGQVGALLLFAVAPLVVNRHQPSNFFTLLSLITVPALLASVCSLFVSSRPPTPPSLSAAAVSEATTALAQTTTFDDDEEMGDNRPSDFHASNEQRRMQSDFVEHERRKPYLLQIWSLFCNWQFLVLCLSMGNGFGVVNSYHTNVQQMLCARGFPPELADTMGLVQMPASLFAAALISRFVDRTRLFEETIKTLYALVALFCVAMTVLLQVLDEPTLLAKTALITVAALTSMASTAPYALGLETAIEMTFPMPEATPTGVIIQIGQLQGIFWLLVITLLRRSPPVDDPIWALQTCQNDASGGGGGKGASALGVFDWRPSLWAYALLAVGNAIFIITLFRPRYRRMAFERDAQERQNGSLNPDGMNDLSNDTSISSS